MGLLDIATLPARITVAATDDRLLQPNGLPDQLLTEGGIVQKLVSEGGALNTLGRAVEPLRELANRLPGSRRRAAIQA